ncbi:MAG: hypothetical protein JXJ17_18530 [Anaerolineae bacterium]|nr:hypothetical protein [Anaerolineae bacterium]
MGSKESEQNKTRFFSMRRSTLAMAGLAVALLIALLVTGLIVRSNERKQLDPDFLPRYTNIWSIYGDDRVRFVTLIFPAPDDSSEVVNVAGPLVPDQAAVEDVRAIGGEILTGEYPLGPGHDSTNFYGLYTVEREELLKGYGIDVLAQRSPYVTVDETDPAMRELALGAQLPGVYKQVIVAVAFPRGTEIVETAGEEPIHEEQIGGWQVYYYDASHFEGSETIRVTYLPDTASSPRELDPWRVDSKR